MDKSKISFGFDQIENQTPPIAIWIFRSYFILSKAFLGWAAAVGIFSPEHLKVITLTITLLLDPVVLGFSKLFGVEPEPVDPEKSFVADKQVDDKGNTQSIPPVTLAPQPVAAAPLPIEKKVVPAVVCEPDHPISYDEALKNA